VPSLRDLLTSTADELEGLTGLTVQALVLRANGMPGFVPTGELVLTLGL
jgi:hypothetical protein